MEEEEGDAKGNFALSDRLSSLKQHPVFVTYLNISDQFRDRATLIGDWTHSFVDGQARRFYRTIFRSPGPIVIVMILLTLLVGKDAMDFGQQINGDVEIYLPDGADSTELLLDVREQWSTDIVLLYIHTDNAIDDESRRGSEKIGRAHV